MSEGIPDRMSEPRMGNGMKFGDEDRVMLCNKLQSLAINADNFCCD